MINSNIIQKFISYFDNVNTIALICHINPDGDTLGSALALKRMFEKLNKEASVFCDDKPLGKLSFFPYVETVNTSDNKLFDLAIAVDCSDAGRLGISNKYFKKAGARLTIDHHKTNFNFADYTICDPKVSATAELVYQVICYIETQNNIKIMDAEIALLLFSALVTDSGAFSYSNTSSETLDIASSLKQYDFDASDTIYKLIRSTSVKDFKLKSRVLNNAKFYEDNRICIITFSNEDFEATGTSTENTEGVIPEIINIDSVQVAISIAEVYDKYYKVSFRTKEPYDASECAGVFGGGGHVRAAGCRLNGFYEDIIDRLLKVSKDLIL